MYFVTANSAPENPLNDGERGLLPGATLATCRLGRTPPATWHRIIKDEHVLLDARSIKSMILSGNMTCLQGTGMYVRDKLKAHCLSRHPHLGMIYSYTVSTRRGGGWFIQHAEYPKTGNLNAMYLSRKPFRSNTSKQVVFSDPGPIQSLCQP